MPTIQVNIDRSVFNEVYLPHLDSTERYEVLYGGAGSGKSHFVAQKKILQHLSERGHKTLVVRKVANTLRNSVFSLLQGVIADWNVGQLFKVNKSDMEINCVNGNKFIFAGLDDVEKLKSIHGITDVWIEEASEISQEDFQQLDLRLRGASKVVKQITLTFNPVSIVHWLKTYFFDQMIKNCIRLKTTYKDNKFIGEEYEAVLLALKDKDPYFYTVYAQGEWGVIGKTIFPAQIVSERIAYLRDKPPIKRGFFAFEYEADHIKDDTITWIDDADGYISIYQEPRKGCPYVIGGDTAGDGSDNFIGQVLDNTNGAQVAVLKHQFDEDLYCRQMYCLGHHYNEALEGIEINFSTFPVKELRRLGYIRQYRREVIDQISKVKQYKDGFQTTKLSRPLIIAGLVQLVREHPELFNDIATLEEMLTFVRNEKGKAAAQEGKHDDLIMGLAIAHFVASQQTDIVDIELVDDRDYPEEAWMYEDGTNTWFD